MKASDFATLVVLAALWGGSYLFIRVGVPSLGPLPLMGGRVALAGVVLWVVLRAIGQRVSLRPYAGRLVILGLLNAALPYALNAWAELRLDASFVAVLSATVPLFGAVIGTVWLHERITALRAGGLLLGFVGVMILAGWSPVPLTAMTLLGIGATLVASLLYAAAGVYSKCTLADVPAPTLALGQQAGALVWLLVPAAVQLPAVRPTAGSLGALAALAVLSTSVAYVLFFRLIARVGPTRTQTVTYLIPMFGMLWGALFLDERITGGMLVAFGCIAGSMVLVNGIRLPRRASLRTAGAGCGAGHLG